MISPYAKGLVKAGYLNSKGKELKASMSSGEWKNFLKTLSDKQATDLADEELAEESRLEPTFDGKMAQYYPTGYPPPIKRFKLVLESANNSIEEMYYWMLGQLREDHGYVLFDKITDTFSASEQSAFWGAAQTRMKIQQDNVSQYLATIGKMVKELFQLVRELRIIDERMEIYDNAHKMTSADITLKGLYVDLVEGASKNPGSVYGLAQQVGFTILPDLFFNTHIHKQEELDNRIDSMKYNKAIKNVLKRKLLSYIVWKEKTHKELKDRRKFQLKYLRQHWVIIKMYMDWIKPYLRNIRRMQMSEKHIESVDLIGAFESSMVEIEFLAKKPADVYHPIIMGSFEFRTSPELTFHQDNYQHKGPIHIGRATMELRAYAWTPEEVEKYKKYRQQENMELFSVIDGSVKAAMDALGEDIENYLREAGEDIEEKYTPDDKKKQSKKLMKSLGILEPFWAVIKGFGELGAAIIPMPNIGGGGSSTKKEVPAVVKKDKKKKAGGSAAGAMWLAYKNYKKAHRMITW